MIKHERIGKKKKWVQWPLEETPTVSIVHRHRLRATFVLLWNLHRRRRAFVVHLTPKTPKTIAFPQQSNYREKYLLTNPPYRIDSDFTDTINLLHVYRLFFFIKTSVGLPTTIVRFKKSKLFFDRFFIFSLKYDTDVFVRSRCMYDYSRKLTNTIWLFICFTKPDFYLAERLFQASSLVTFY